MWMIRRSIRGPGSPGQIPYSVSFCWTAAESGWNCDGWEDNLHKDHQNFMHLRRVICMKKEEDLCSKS